MSFSRSHVMASNQRLIRQINYDLFGQAYKTWERMYTEFCKRHGDLMPNKVMQFNGNNDQNRMKFSSVEFAKRFLADKCCASK